MNALAIAIWHLGKLVAFTSAIFCLGACAAWFFDEKEEPDADSEALVRPSPKLLSVYFHLIMSFALTMFSMTAALQCPFMMQIIVRYPVQLILGVALVLHFLVSTLENPAALAEHPIARVAAWLAFSTLPGPVLAVFGPDICSKTALCTFFSSLVANAGAYVAPKDLNETLRYPLKVLYSISSVTLLLCSVTSHSNLLGLTNLAASLYGGMLLFFGVFITHAQLVFQDLDRISVDPMFTASVMYLATLNMFLRIALFFVVDSTSILS